MLYKDKFFKISYGIILILIILFLIGQIPYVINPLMKVLTIVLLPLLLGGFLYYLLRPLARTLNEKVDDKRLSIVITFLIIITLISLIVFFGGSIIYTEVKRLIDYSFANYDSIIQNVNSILQLGDGKLSFLNQFNLHERLISFSESILRGVTEYNFTSAFSSLTNFGMILLLTPIVLFYLLKDDDQIYQVILYCIPKAKQKRAIEVLEEVDNVLASYIGGQLIVAFILGIFMMFGYLIIGLPNAIALALIAMITSLIPIVGPTLGILPALFITLSTNLMMVVKLAIVLSISQYLEGNLVRPLVQGEKLHIHPLIVLFIVLIAILLFGVLGALLAVPAYAVGRILLKEFLLKEDKIK